MNPDLRIHWTTPSADSSGSMPLGNGEIGINLWVEDAGEHTDIRFYLARTDAWDENGRLCKLGRVRLRLGVPPWPFEQTLNLARGRMVLRCGPATVTVWVDAHAPVVWIEGRSDQPVHLQAAIELWRTAPREVTSHKEAQSFSGQDPAREPIVILPDAVIPGQQNRVVWYHRNTASCWANSLRVQELAALIPRFPDPLLDRTFGGILIGDGLVNTSDHTLVTREPRREFAVSVRTHTAQAASVAEWLGGFRAPVPDRAAHEACWREFWSRSWIHITGDADAESVTRGYAIQRFLAACGGRGTCPIKFNGSLFTVDAREPDETFDPDYRRWGGPYWFQNTRLIYWPCLMSGDYDLLQPLFQMYLRALPLARARTQDYFGHGGAMFPETMNAWGTYRNCDYGYDRAGLARGVAANPWIRYHWQGALELIALLLDYRDYTGDGEALRELADPIIEFYDRHYPRKDGRGHRILEPGQALETWLETLNSLPDVAGLHDVLPRLGGWDTLLAELPPVPDRRELWSGRRYLIPALQYDRCGNWENPELYAILPFRLHGVGLPDLAVGRETYARRTNQATGCWRQDAIQAACLGLTADARRDVVHNFAAKHPGSRFEGFLGPNYDWIPDLDHGGVAMIALQRMLLQHHGDRLHLLPAWPREWSVHFKLHAPRRTTIEAVARHGKIESLVVTPQARQHDVQVNEG